MNFSFWFLWEIVRKSAWQGEKIIWMEIDSGKKFSLGPNYNFGTSMIRKKFHFENNVYN